MTSRAATPKEHELVYVNPERTEAVCACGTHLSVPQMTLNFSTIVSEFARHIRDEHVKARENQVPGGDFDLLDAIQDLRNEYATFTPNSKVLHSQIESDLNRIINKAVGRARHKA